MSKSVLGLILVIVGLAGNNYAYLHDLIAKGADCIWMGPQTGIMAVVSILVICVGAWLATQSGGSQDA